jgi:hypothetical protein
MEDDRQADVDRLAAGVAARVKVALVAAVLLSRRPVDPSIGGNGVS